MKSIYIGNVDYKASRQDIFDLFAQFGEVVSLTIISDKKTKKHKGYAFVEMSDENANNAISMLNNELFFNKNIIVKEAATKKKAIQSKQTK